MTKEAFIVPTRRDHSFNQRFRSLFQAFTPLISTIGLEDVKASEADRKPHIFLESVSFQPKPLITSIFAPATGDSRLVRDR